MEVVWITNEVNNYSGVKRYSEELIEGLKKEYNINIRKESYLGKKIGYYFWKYIILSFKVFIFKSNTTIVIPDESFLFLSIFSRSKNKIAIIHDVRKSQGKNLRESIKSFLMKINFFFVLRFEHIVCVSDFTKKSLISYLQNVNVNVNVNVSVVHNIIEPQLFSNDFDNLNISRDISEFFSDDEIFFLYLGSHESRKNTIELVKAFLENERKGMKGKLIICGTVIDFDNYNIVKELSKESSSILILGSVSDKDLNFLFYNSDFFINPSLFEGFGRTPVEAQAYGIPVVSTFNSALEEVLLPGSFIKINEPSDYNEIMKAVFNAVNISLEERHVYISLGRKNARRFSQKSGVDKFKEVLF